MHFVGGTSDELNGKYLGEWYTRISGYTISAPYYAIGFSKNKSGELVKIDGYCIISNYTGKACEMHIHAPGCFNRETIKHVYNYVFNVLGCNLFVALVKRDNKTLLKILSRLNNKAYTTTYKRYFGDTPKDDAIVFIFDRQWASKWIKINGRT